MTLMTKWPNFWPLPHPHHSQKWTIDLLSKNNRIHKNVTNFNSPTLFRVDVINVWSLGKIKFSFCNLSRKLECKVCVKTVLNWNQIFCICTSSLGLRVPFCNCWFSFPKAKWNASTSWLGLARFSCAKIRSLSNRPAGSS